MLADVLNLYGMEGTDADLEGEVVKGSAVLFEILNELGGKMESGGGGGDCLLFRVVGVDGLVAFVVAALSGVVRAALNIGWKGHDADTLRECGDGFAIGGLKADAVVTVLPDFKDLGGVDSL